MSLVKKVQIIAAVLVVALLAVASPHAQNGTLMPAPKFTGLDNSGNPISGGKLCTYAAGTTTPQATYSDVALATPNANPVILDSAGRTTVYLSATSYKFILKTAGSDSTCNTGTTIWTQDNVSAVPGSSASVDVLGTTGEAISAGQSVYLSDGSGGKTGGLWYKADATNTYSSTVNYVGLAPSAIGSGSAGTMRIAGSVTGLSALSVGSLYYVSSTAGALTATAPTNRRLLGQADSTTSLVLVANPPTISTLPTLTANAIVKGGGAGVLPTTQDTFTFNAQNFLSSTSQPRVAVHHSTTQSIANATWTALAFDTEDIDVGNLHDNVTNNTRLTIPTGGDGLYLCSGTVNFTNGSAANNRAIRLLKNGATQVSTFSAQGATNFLGTSGGLAASALLSLVATDYVEAQAYQDSTAALNVGDASIRMNQSQAYCVKVW